MNHARQFFDLGNASKSRDAIGRLYNNQGIAQGVSTRDYLKDV